MQAISIEKEKVTIEFSTQELVILKNALKTVCDELEEWEFEIRMGVILKYSQDKIEILNSILKEAKEEY